MSAVAPEQLFEPALCYHYAQGLKLQILLGVPKRGYITLVDSPESQNVDSSAVDTRRSESQQSELHHALLAFALDHVREAAYLVDERAHFIYVNAEACRSLGFSKTELLNLTVNDINPEWSAEHSLELWLALKTQGFLTFETRHRSKDGRIFPVELTANYFEYEGRPYNLAMARDITERKQFEDDLRVREHYQRALLDNFPFMVWLKDTESRLLTVNRQYVEAADCDSIDRNSPGFNSVDALYGKTDFDCWPFELAEGYRADDLEIMRTGQTKIVDEPIESHGVRRWHETYKAPVVNADGKLLGTVGFARDITERREQEERLRESEQRYRQIFDNVSDALYLIEVTKDNRFRYIETNPALEKSMGKSRDELIGKYFDEAAGDETTQKIIAKYHRCIKAGVKTEEEIELNLPSGHRVFHSTLIPIHDETGRIHRIVGICRDITEHKHNEKLQQQQIELEMRLAKIAEASPGVFFTYLLKPDGTASMPYASPRLWDVMGIRPEDAAKDASLSFFNIHPDDLSRVAELTAESASALQPWHHEYRVLHPSKGEIWIEGRSTPERQPNGSTLWYGFLHDVTKRKLAEKLLHNHTQEFRTLVEHSPDIVVRYDRECRRTYVNPAFVKLNGVPAQQVLGMTPREFFGATMSAQEFMDRLQQVINTGEEAEFTLEMLHADGQPTYHLMRAVPEYDQYGNISSVLGIMRNITILKEAERRLHESRIQIRDLAVHRERTREEERKHIAREVHDELGQLLGALHLRVQVFSSRLDKSDPFVEKNIQYMANLVDQAQRVARNITSALRPAALDMGIVSALEWQAEEFHKYAGIPCHLNASNDIALDEEHATAILRIVQESLTNVMRHAEATEVRIMLEKQEDAYVLEVHDNGKGFVPEKISKKKSFGLAGIRERAAMLGGDIVITSIQQGTTLRVCVPILEATGDPQ